MFRILHIAVKGSVCAVLIGMSGSPMFALATGTARIQQADGDVKVYKNVRIDMEHKQLSVTSADGVGTIVLTKAACSPVDKLVRCYPYNAELKQHGRTIPITIVEGTAWFNPSSNSQSLPNSSTQLGPRGVMVSVRTKRGTYLSLSGVADVMKK
jgi:hypothetical protein